VRFATRSADDTVRLKLGNRRAELGRLARVLADLRPTADRAAVLGLLDISSLRCGKTALFVSLNDEVDPIARAHGSSVVTVTPSMLDSLVVEVVE
jgi:hypothetical protein